MKLLAAVADSAERAIENNVMVLDNSSSVKGKILVFVLRSAHHVRAVLQSMCILIFVPGC